MIHRAAQITGFVLAGGASRRMGRPKALLTLDGETMIERQIRRLRAVAGRVVVLGPPELLLPLEAEIIADEMPGRGPLGAIYTGLLHTRTEYNLFLGCDLPNITPAFLAALARRAFQTEADATWPRIPPRGDQPLCAVYRRRALPAIRAALERGENRVRRLARRVRCQRIGWPELRRAGFGRRIFDNMNTPADYADARRRWDARKP